MPEPTTAQRLRGLILSANDLRVLTKGKWPDALIEDYLNLFDNLITISDLLDIEIDQTLEEVPTDFTDGSVPFADDGFLIEENPGLTWDNVAKILTVIGTIIGTDLIATATTTSPIIYGGDDSGDDVMINSNPNNDGLIILGNSTTGLVFDEDDEAATIGGGEIIHTINGSNEKSLFEFHQDGNTAPGGITFHRHSNTDALSSDIVFLRSKGDHATPLVVVDDSSLGKIRATGFDGTDEAESSEVAFEVDGTPGDDDMPGRIIFKTSADGTQTPIEALRIDSSQNSLFSGNVYSNSDSNKYYAGAGTDMAIHYDGTDGHIVTNLVAPSDLNIDCGTDKTIELQETVYNDLVLPLDSARVPAANAPSWESFVGNLNAYAYAVNDYQEFTAELLHGYDSGSDLEFHVHGALNAALAAGNETVKFEIEYSIANMDATDGLGDVFPATTTINAEFIVPDTTADLTNIYISIGTDTTTSFAMGATIKGRIRRIASSGAELVGDIFVTQVGIHYEINTMGSRQRTVK